MTDPAQRAESVKKVLDTGSAVPQGPAPSRPIPTNCPAGPRGPACSSLRYGSTISTVQTGSIFFSSDYLTNLWRCVHAALSLCPPPRTSPYLPPRQTPPRHPAPSPPFPPWPLSFSHNRTSPGSSTGPRTPSFLQVTPYPLYHHADLSTTSDHSCWGATSS